MSSSFMFFTDCGSSKPIGTVCLAKIDTKLSLVPLAVWAMSQNSSSFELFCDSGPSVCFEYYTVMKRHRTCSQREQRADSIALCSITGSIVQIRS